MCACRIIQLCEGRGRTNGFNTRFLDEGRTTFCFATKSYQFIALVCKYTDRKIDLFLSFPSHHSLLGLDRTMSCQDLENKHVSDYTLYGQSETGPLSRTHFAQLKRPASRHSHFKNHQQSSLVMLRPRHSNPHIVNLYLSVPLQDPSIEALCRYEDGI